LRIEMNQPAPSYRFPRSHRLAGRRAFAAVFGAKMRKHAGPLTVFARPNDLPHARLGLSVGRRVGNAVRRNRVKRLLREAFRLSRHDWPGGYDIVVAVRPHEPMAVTDYQRLIAKAVDDAHRQWQRRGEQRDPAS
jgi:ribonuclease P protein component